MDTFWQDGMTLAQSERQIIIFSMRRHGGNKTRVAQSLGIAIRTLDNKLKEYQEADDARKARLQGSPAIPKPFEPIPEAKGRDDVEPAPQASPKRTVSMRKRDQVQKVSP